MAVGSIFVPSVPTVATRFSVNGDLFVFAALVGLVPGFAALVGVTLALIDAL